MKGAIAELLASTSRTPNRTRVITIGASQYFLFCFMNSQSSLTTCVFDIQSSKHLFIVAGISLALRVRFPVRITRRRATLQRVPAEPPFDHTDWRDDHKEDKSKNDSRRHP